MQKEHRLVSMRDNYKQLEKMDFATFVVYHVEKVRICFENDYLSGVQFILDNYLGPDLLYGEL